MTFKSPQLHLCGKITEVIDHEPTQRSSFYIKVKFIEGQQWKLLEGLNKFETFQAESLNGVTPIQQSFSLHYQTADMRGWPKMSAQIWKVDSYGRHNIYGYGNLAIPMGSGHYSLQMPCWRPKGSMYDRFIGANSQLQYPGIIMSPLNRYGLRAFSGCIVKINLQVIGRNFHLHGVIRDSKKQQK